MSKKTKNLKTKTLPLTVTVKTDLSLIDQLRDARSNVAETQDEIADVQNQIITAQAEDLARIQFRRSSPTPWSKELDALELKKELRSLERQLTNRKYLVGNLERAVIAEEKEAVAKAVAKAAREAEQAALEQVESTVKNIARITGGFLLSAFKTHGIPRSGIPPAWSKLVEASLAIYPQD